MSIRSILLIKQFFFSSNVFICQKKTFYWCNFPLQRTGLLQEEDEWPLADRSSAKAARLVLLIQPLSLHHCLAEKFPRGSEWGNEWNEIPWEYLTVKRMKWMKTLGFLLENVIKDNGVAWCRKDALTLWAKIKRASNGLLFESCKTALGVLAGPGSRA